MDRREEAGGAHRLGAGCGVGAVDRTSKERHRHMLSGTSQCTAQRFCDGCPMFCVQFFTALVMELYKLYKSTVCSHQRLFLQCNRALILLYCRAMSCNVLERTFIVLSDVLEKTIIMQCLCRV